MFYLDKAISLLEGPSSDVFIIFIMVDVMISDINLYQLCTWYTGALMSSLVTGESVNFTAMVQVDEDISKRLGDL